MNEPERGMRVIGPDGEFGTVDEVIYENTGEPARVLVRRLNEPEMVLQPGAYHIREGALHLGGEQRDVYRAERIGEVGQTETLEVQPGEERVIPVLREQVSVARRVVERGGVRVHKRVEEREEVVEQPAFREEVTVERVPLGRPVGEAIGPRQEGDTLVIPVLEEMLVVEKRLVLKEEIRITKRRIDTTEQARVVLREERVDIEQLGGVEPMA